MRRRRGPDFVLVGEPPARRRSRGLAQACLFGACAVALLGSASPPAAPMPPIAPRVATAAAPVAAPAPLAPSEPLIPAPAPSVSVPAAVPAKKVEPESHQAGGKLRILVSIAEQKAYVFRGGKLVASSRVSTGKRGHETPTGTFPITQKKVRHFSNLYDNAPMPYMQRLAQSAVALHAGHVPGYPASHGCIRLPKAFARRLFAMTDYGTRVTVVRGSAGVAKKAKKMTAPRVRSGQVQGGGPRRAQQAAAKGEIRRRA